MSYATNLLPNKERQAYLDNKRKMEEKFDKFIDDMFGEPGKNEDMKGKCLAQIWGGGISVLFWQ